MNITVILQSVGWFARRDARADRLATSYLQRHSAGLALPASTQHTPMSPSDEAVPDAVQPAANAATQTPDSVPLSKAA